MVRITATPPAGDVPTLEMLAPVTLCAGMALMSAFVSSRWWIWRSAASVPASLKIRILTNCSRQTSRDLCLSWLSRDPHKLIFTDRNVASGMSVASRPRAPGARQESKPSWWAAIERQFIAVSYEHVDLAVALERMGGHFRCHRRRSVRRPRQNKPLKPGLVSLRSAVGIRRLCDLDQKPAKRHRRAENGDHCGAIPGLNEHCRARDSILRR